MKKGIGWISLYRTIQDNWVWKEKPFSKGQAWIDLVLMANHEDKTILYEGKLITVKRGSFITSILKLAERFGWDRKKVKRFLELLECDGMVTTVSTTHGTTVTIVNYGEYQDLSTTNMPRSSTTTGTTSGQQEVQPLPITNKYNNINNDNNNKKDIVELHTTEQTKEIIEYLNLKTGSQYRYQTKATKSYVNARLNEKFSVEDFKTVIDNMCEEWLSDSKMKQYLRPQTLFGTKFESYLNRNPQTKGISGSSKYDDLPASLFG